MARRANTTQTILVGIGALIAGYLAYGEYKKYKLKQLVADAQRGKPGSTIEFLETNSNKSGSGVKTVVVPVGVPTDPWLEDFKSTIDIDSKSDWF